MEMVTLSPWAEPNITRQNTLFYFGSPPPSKPVFLSRVG